MGRFLLRRLLQAVPTLLGVAGLTFLLFHAVAPDPVVTALGQHATPQAVANLRRVWGLDQPLTKQFVGFLHETLTGDYGRSFITGENIASQLLRGAWVSLSVTLPPFVMAGLINVALALYSIGPSGRQLDHAVRAASTAAMSVSALVYAVLAQYVLAYQLGWFPISGYERGFGAVAYLALPWIIMIVLSLGPDIRLYRAVFIEEIRADYVQTARSKGASESRVLWRHVLPNAWLPIITNNVTSIPFLMLGSFILERFFSIPGIGSLTIDALNQGDLPVLKAVTMWGAMALVLANVVNDLLYAAADPRLRLA